MPKCNFTKVTNQNKLTHQNKVLYFPNISKDTNHRHILLTRTDRCNSKLSKNIYFEKDIHSFTNSMLKIRKKAYEVKFLICKSTYILKVCSIFYTL